MHHRKLRHSCTPEELTMTENLIPLCLVCHEYVHRHPTLAVEGGYIVLSFDDPREIPVNTFKAHDHQGVCKVCGVGILKKQSKPRFKGEARRTRRVIAVRVPDDWEDGGAVWDETLEQVKRELVVDELYEDEERIPNYEAVVAAMRDYIDTRQLVRGFREHG